MTLVRIALACLVALAPIAAQSQAEGIPSERIKGVPNFDAPRFAEQQIVVEQMIRAKALDQATEGLDAMIQRFPEAPRLRILKAEVAISRQDPETAIAALTEASALGSVELAETLAAPAFREVAQDTRIRALLASPPSPAAKAPFSPGLVKKGIGVVTAENTRWNEKLARLEVAFAPPPSQRSKPVSRLKDEITANLTKMVRRGEAAGNFGDVYDNRDGRHSQLGGLKMFS